MAFEVPIEKLHRVCDDQDLNFSTTGEIAPLVGILGQERALRALQFGLGTRSEGFNVYVAGSPGTGRTTAVMAYLQGMAKQQPVPSDWCYVNNFRDPYHPHAMRLSPGQATRLRVDMEALVAELRRRIPLLFEDEQYAEKRNAVTVTLQEQRQKILAGLAQVAQQAGFLIEASSAGLALVPLKDGRPLSDEEFAALDEPQRQEILTRRLGLEAQVDVATKQVRLAERRIQEQVQALDHEMALIALRPAIAELKDKYATSADVLVYLDAVQTDILDQLAAFQGEENAAASEDAGPSPAEFFRRYAVNALVDNSESMGAPVLTEDNPSYDNLFGRIEREAEFGALITDFTMLKGGTLQRANGGYLVLPAEHLIEDSFAWVSLKRALRSGLIGIEDASERTGGVPVKSVRPEPVPLDIKIILIGDPQTYYVLYDEDPDFRELFKVKADFDTRMQRTSEHVRAYLGFVSALCQRERLRPVQRAAAAKIVEYSSRLAEDQEQLSTHFAQVADILREADYYAVQDDLPQITYEHVQKAIAERVYRSDMLQQELRKDVDDGTLLIDTTGTATGQVNGLSVLEMGDYAFGFPTRITATIGMGKEGVVDIEREARLGGSIHTKGVLILSGLLHNHYAQDKPLNLSAHIVFEQSYSDVDGDSASTAELYALLSRLAGLPLKQGLAITGSVNQCGQVQAIGGVNEKVEGFFAVCQARGLTGEQGVIIPSSNVRNLMLKEDVVEAVRTGAFHVYAVDSIDQGMELLSGVPAGTRNPDGQYPDGTFHARVDTRLRQLAEDLEHFGDEDDPDPHS